jgi:serine/threonine-protein kinase
MDTSVADPLVGHVLDGRYRVDSKVARGGMATVYLGHDAKLERTLALKVMHPNLATDEEFVRRFIGEAKAAAALSHPNIVAVFDQGTDRSGHVYLAMEYVQGSTLRDVLDRHARLGPESAVQIMTQLLGALSAAHRIGLVHRDVKPENLLISPDGHVKVADFGLARAETASRQTKTGMLIGTVGYLAPEQVLSGSSDARTDVYAAGIMLFEMLTGSQPYQGDNPLSVAYQHVNEVVPLPSSIVPGIPPQLDALVSASTNRDPARRPADAGHFLTLVEEVGRGLPRGIDAMLAHAPRAQRPSGGPAQTSVTARQGTATGSHTMALRTPPTAPAAPARRSGRRAGLIAGAAVALIGLIGWAVWAQTIGQEVKVPALVGLTEHDAVAKATSTGLEVKLGTATYNASIPPGDVASVSPSPGVNVHKGAILMVVPSLGAKPKRVPSVAGLPQDQAVTKLKRAGFRVGTVQQESSKVDDIGDAVKTTPAGRTMASPSNPVTLDVSTGVQVPNVMNQPTNQALQALQQAGLQPQVSSQGQPQNGQQPNTVLSMSPQSGTNVDPGTVVTVTVAGNNCQWFNFFFCNGNNGNNGNNGHGNN